MRGQKSKDGTRIQGERLLAPWLSAYSFLCAESPCPHFLVTPLPQPAHYVSQGGCGEASGPEDPDPQPSPPFPFSQAPAIPSLDRLGQWRCPSPCEPSLQWTAPHGPISQLSLQLQIKLTTGERAVRERGVQVDQGVFRLL